MLFQTHMMFFLLLITKGYFLKNIQATLFKCISFNNHYLLKFYFIEKSE